MTDATGKLATVRRLLAKAESTEFPDEARALTLKAQELMVRHALDEALVAAGDFSGDDIATVVVGVDAPYRRAKGYLLTRVADANRCHVVEETVAGTVRFHLTGFVADTEQVQLLFTSLLLQAAREMLAVPVDPWLNLRSFRHAFLVGYGTEIGDRLAARAESVVAVEADRAGSDLLPVLADRKARVADEVDRRWSGTLRSSRITYRPGGGYSAGRKAGRRADVSRRRLAPRRSLPR